MLNTPLTLPCGALLTNRLVKAAMTERLSNADDAPNKLHANLYDYWAKCRAGLMITGNVMVESNHLESAGNVVVMNDSILPSMQKWTNAGKQFGHHIWAQISHAGRQTSRMTNTRPLSASNVQLKKNGAICSASANDRRTN